jgi:hypothetical protein
MWVPFTCRASWTLKVYWRVAMRRVLHLKQVTQCAMLEDFGIFLVLADKVSMFTYSAITILT